MTIFKIALRIIWLVSVICSVVMSFIWISAAEFVIGGLWMLSAVCNVTLYFVVESSFKFDQILDYVEDMDRVAKLVAEDQFRNATKEEVAK